MEQSQTMHLILWVISAYLFFLFAGWWIYIRSATTLYKITCLLFFGSWLSYFGAWYLYHQAMCGMSIHEILNYKYWFLRNSFVLVAFVLYAVHITRKILNPETRKGRRIGDL
jgi:hypothetical protein